MSPEERSEFVHVDSRAQWAQTRTGLFMNACIVIPTYNEAENLEPLLHRILELHPDFRVLVVDDNSPDGTGRIADRIAAQD